MRFSSRQLEHEFRRRIVTGVYLPGERIPAERNVAEEFACSRGTVSKVMAALVADGLLEQVQGAGAFVTEAAGRPQRCEPVVAQGEGKVIHYLSPAVDGRVVNSRNCVLEGLHEVLVPQGYTVAVSFYGSGKEYAAAMGRLQSAGAAGAVIWAQPDQQGVAVLKRLLSSGLPVVLIDTYLPEVACDWVVSDNARGAEAMVGHLAARGHREICYLTAAPDRSSVSDRLAGFLRGMVANRLPVEAASVVEVAGGELATRLAAVLQRRKRPTALMASHDVLAIEVLEFLKRKGICVPQEMAVAGFDGIESGTLTSPALTTLKQDFRAMAVHAANILPERLNGLPPQIVVQRMIQPRLVIRRST